MNLPRVALKAVSLALGIAAVPAVLTGANAETPALVLRVAPPQLLPPASVAAANRAATPGTVSADRKTLTLRGKSIRLVVHTGPDDDMLSYRIAGLRNPTLIVPRGATLRVLFVNDDGDMRHDVRFSGAKPPFAQSLNAKLGSGTPELKPVSNGSFYADEMVLRTPSKPGTLTYLCTVAGHARGGMFGTMRIR